MSMVEKVADRIIASLVVQANDEGGYLNMMNDGIARIDGDFSTDALARAAIEAMRDEIEARLKHDEEGVIDWIDAALLEHVPEHQ